jgi:two-component system LytT family response regulator
MSVFIADDDAGMRLVLRKIVESMDGVQCVGEGADGAEAVKRCAELKPDIVFLDVDMPTKTGLQAAKEITEMLPETTLVFCTAHSEYMPDAFELYAADYLMKPFKTDRVRQTIRRIRKSQIQSKTVPARTIMIKNRDGITFLPVSDIILICRDNRTTNIETTNGSFMTSDSLNELWKRLEGGDFFRSHRAYIISISAINTMYPYGRWTYLVSMRNTEKTALITHEKLKELQELLHV